LRQAGGAGDKEGELHLGESLTRLHARRGLNFRLCVRLCVCGPGCLRASPLLSSEWAQAAAAAPVWFLPANSARVCKGAPPVHRQDFLDVRALCGRPGGHGLDPEDHEGATGLLLLLVVATSRAIVVSLQTTRVLVRCFWRPSRTSPLQCFFGLCCLLRA
jgi:hypothetical protein